MGARQAGRLLGGGRRRAGQRRARARPARPALGGAEVSGSRAQSNLRLHGPAWPAPGGKLAGRPRARCWPRPQISGRPRARSAHGHMRRREKSGPLLANCLNNDSCRHIVARGFGPANLGPLAQWAQVKQRQRAPRSAQSQLSYPVSSSRRRPGPAVWRRGRGPVASRLAEPRARPTCLAAGVHS